MSTREKPYRSKANAAFFQLIQSALQSTFFLVHESGPTSFALKDEQGKVIKVSLGSTHTCTCGGGRSEHCIHTLYVLLKIFRVLPDNPIIWQTAFIDSEINWLIRNRMHPVVQEKTTKKIIPNSQVARIDIKEEFGCAICQEDLKDLNGLIFCKEGCGHNFHLKCMKIWAEFKTEQKNNITCPLCRCNWGAKTLGEINKLMRKNKKKPQIHSRSTCVGCGCSPITGVKYHCLMCYEFDFCSNCFRTQHGEHPFIKKSSPSSNWEPAVRMNGESLVNREFSPEDYEFLQQLDTIPILSEYIFSLLPDASPGVCQICKVEQQTHWKRLACGHTVHDVINK